MVPVLSSRSTPRVIRLRLANGETAMVPVSVQVPPDTIPTVVDLVFAVDGRASFTDAVSRLQGAVPVHRIHAENARTRGSVSLSR